MQNVTCPITIVQKPNPTSASESVERSAIPVTMPGRAIGRTTTKATTFLPKNFARYTAPASRPPSTIATPVEIVATSNESRTAPHMSSSPNATENHLVVKPGGGKVNAEDWVVNAYS